MKIGVQFNRVLASGRRVDLRRVVCGHKGNPPGPLITAALGAVVLLFLAGLIRKKSRIFDLRDGGPKAKLGANALRRSVVWERLRNRPWHSAGPRPVGAHTSCSTVRSFTGVATLGLAVFVAVLLWPRPLAAAPVPVRFVEGTVHGFLVLRTVKGVLIASGDLLQVVRGGEVESRVVFRFNDGSVFDETAVFTQQRVFALQSYRQVQGGAGIP
jgi:hypothetical protein